MGTPIVDYWARKNLKGVVLVKPLQIVLISLPVNLSVCPRCIRLGIYSIFYRNLHTWI